MATRREWIFDLVMLLVGVVLTIESLRLGLGTLHHPGPGFLPILTGTVLSFVALLCLFKNLLAAREENDTDGEKFFSRPLINVLKISIALIVYVIAFPWLGYLLSTFILLLFLFKIGGMRKWGFILAVAFFTVSVCYLLFDSWLNIRLPVGFLGF